MEPRKTRNTRAEEKLNENHEKSEIHEREEKGRNEQREWVEGGRFDWV
jgi:hypothetical protein